MSSGESEEVESFSDWSGFLAVTGNESEVGEGPEVIPFEDLPPEAKAALQEQLDRMAALKRVQAAAEAHGKPAPISINWDAGQD
jgi:hypothetical protein